MVDSLIAAVLAVVRCGAVALLALLAAVHVVGFMFLAYGSLMDADIQVKGGAVTLVVGATTTVLSLLGIRALTHGRAEPVSYEGARLP